MVLIFSFSNDILNLVILKELFMAELNKILNDMELIDAHLHIYKYQDDKGGLFLNAFDEYIDKFNFRAINVASLPSGVLGVGNNILCALYKLTGEEKIYAHAGLIYNESARNCGDIDPLSQYNELMEIGFDGFKMIEGKPSYYKRIRIPLDDPFYDEFYSACERDGTHILSHVADPADFWDASRVDPEHIKKGWFYGDGTYPTKEELTHQVEGLLEKHPKLSLTLAHFFFLSSEPRRLSALFEKYKGLAVDITPGGEMYIDFNSHHDYFKDFFTKYSSRILLGTDGDFPNHMPAMEWLMDRICKFVATDLATDAWGSSPLVGLKLEPSDAKRILCDNFLSRVGEAPRKINRKALKEYIERHKHRIGDKGVAQKIEELSKKLL